MQKKGNTDTVLYWHLVLRKDYLFIHRERKKDSGFTLRSMISFEQHAGVLWTAWQGMK